MPAYTIAHNAGLEGAVVVGKLLDQSNLNIGYDAAKGLFPIHGYTCAIKVTHILFARTRITSNMLILLFIKMICSCGTPPS